MGGRRLSQDLREAPSQCETAETIAITHQVRFARFPWEGRSREERHESCTVGQHVQKLILLSVILMTFALPAWVARSRHSHEYRSVLAPFSVCVAVYAALLLFVYPRLF